MNIKPILNNFKTQVKNLYGENLVDVILYGSYARGDFKAHSDIDLMVLLNQKDNIKNEKLSDISYSFLINEEILINAFPAEKSEFESFWNPFISILKKKEF